MQFELCLEKKLAKCKPVAGPRWVKAKKWPSLKVDIPVLNVVDLFCGFGGLTLGAWEGARVCGRRIEVALAADLSHQPVSVYRKNFNLSESIAVHASVESLFDGDLGDVYTESEKKLSNRISSVDLLLAGPPCQGHSDLNNSTRRKDPRNALYLRVIRAVEVLRPSAVIIENVPAVLRDEGAVVRKAIDTLVGLGYSVDSAIIKLNELGVPQKRKRHVLVATLNKEFSLEQCLNSYAVREYAVGDYLAGIEDESEQCGSLLSSSGNMTEVNKMRVDYLFDNDLYDLPNELRPTCHKEKAHSYVSMYGRIKWEEPAQTITGGFGSMGQGRFVHPTRRRLITCHEAARLQGVPDFFDFSSVSKVTALREMIGNAVPPQLSAVVIKALIDKKVI